MTSIGEMVRQNLLRVRIVIAKEDLRIAIEHNDWMRRTSAAEVARIFAEYGEPLPALCNLVFFKNRVSELERKQNE